VLDYFLYSCLIISSRHQIKVIQYYINPAVFGKKNQHLKSFLKILMVLIHWFIDDIEILLVIVPKNDILMSVVAKVL